MSFTDRLRHAWDAFRNRDPTRTPKEYYGMGYTRNPDKVRLTINTEQSILASIYNRIAIDCAAIDIRHVKVDQNGRYSEDVDDDLNQCFTVSPNLDQTPRAFFQDLYISLFDEGYIAMFPSEADLDPLETMSYKIQSIRRAKIVEWFPESVRLEAYNPTPGKIEQIIMPKKLVCIIENPLFAVMNGPNSTLQRLVSKLNLLDAIDRQSGSGKMDLIIQLPYSLKSTSKQELAESRRKQIEVQLTDSKYGIAYIDATERVTQLNRPVENNLLTQIEYLETMLYSQLGLTTGVMNGTAEEQEMLNYNSRTIEPIVSAVAAEAKRKWLTKTARTQGHSIMFFRDPFKLVPAANIAEIADKLTRNEILTSNEVRALMGYRPSNDPKANELRNSNIAASKQDVATEPVKEEVEEE